jgi:hypothetical protein
MRGSIRPPLRGRNKADVAIIAVADRKLIFTGGASEPDLAIAVCIIVLDQRRIGPLGSSQARAHRRTTSGAILARFVRPG